MSLADVVPVRLFHDGAFRWRLLTRALDPADWLQFDDEHEQVDRFLAEKERVLREHADDATGWLPGSEPPATEVARLVHDQVRERGRAVPTRRAGEHPLVWAARSVQEDLCLLQRGERGWIFTAAAVCFPTRWSPAAKVGLELTEVHAPVPRYDTIAATVDRFFDRLRPGALAWRPNWSIVGDDRLRLPADDRQAPATVSHDPVRSLWLRVERQTVRRLVDHADAIVFGIRIHRWPLAEAVEGLETAMAAELRQVPEDVARYKNLERWRLDLASRLEKS